jgi:hypothetical protein
MLRSADVGTSCLAFFVVGPVNAVGERGRTAPGMLISMRDVDQGRCEVSRAGK